MKSRGVGYREEKTVHVQTLYRVLDFLDFGPLSKLSKIMNLDFVDYGHVAITHHPFDRSANNSTKGSRLTVFLAFIDIYISCHYPT